MKGATMNIVRKLVFAAALALVALSAMAAEPAIVDTGKGGLRAVLTLDMDGPYDFAKNKGVKVFKGGRLTGGEAMFLGNVSDTAIAIDQLMVDSVSENKPGDTPLTAEHIADQMLQTVGFTVDRAVKFDGPKVSIPGATVATYKASGHPIFERTRTDSKVFVIVQAVSYPGQTKGYAIMSAIKEKNVAAFDADPAKYEKLAKAGFMPIFRGLTVSEN